MSELKFLKKVIKVRTSLMSRGESHKSEYGITEALTYFNKHLKFYGKRFKDSGARALIKNRPDLIIRLIPGKDSACHKKFHAELSSILNP